MSAGVAVNSGISGQAIQRAAEQGRKALVAYYPVGYPDVAGSLNVLRTLCGEGDTPGADLIEIGLPYSDPVMDGVVIQRAGTRALARGVRTRDVFTAVETVASTGTTPVVIDAIRQLDDLGMQAEYYCCIYATVPLIQAGDLSAAHDRLLAPIGHGRSRSLRNNRKQRQQHQQKPLHGIK